MTTTDDFTEAARAEAERRWPRLPQDPSGHYLNMGKRVGFDLGARWARAHLAAQEPTAAEHRIARLEAQSDIRGRAVVIYRERAREAEAERDCRRRENAELRDELVATQEYGAKLAHGKDEAEARIEAVQALHTGTRWPSAICDACDQPRPCPTIRALDGDT